MSKINWFKESALIALCFVFAFGLVSGLKAVTKEGDVDMIENAQAEELILENFEVPDGMVLDVSSIRTGRIDGVTLYEANEKGFKVKVAPEAIGKDLNITYSCYYPEAYDELVEGGWAK